MRFGGSVIQGTKDRGAGRFRFWHLGTAAQRLREGVVVFGIGPATRIYLALGATDMRKGFEGLYGLVRDRLQLEPLSGHVFLFCNKARNRTKVLFWDGSGLWICAKANAPHCPQRFLTSSLSVSPSFKTSSGGVWSCWRSARSGVCADAKQCNTWHSGVDV